MTKDLFILILSLMFFQAAKAQKLDTVLVNMKNNGRIVEAKDSADYFLQVMMPPDSSTGIKINEVKEFYTNHKLKLVGRAMIYVNGWILNLKFVGLCVDYFPNGYKKSIANYRNGLPVGDVSLYYPNGQSYALEKYDSANELLVTCHDSTGNVLSENGTGKWVRYNDDFTYITEEGAIKDSLQEGEWHEIINDSVNYTTVYKHGEVISSTDPNRLTQIFAAVEIEPQFKNGGAAGFQAFLVRAVKFPVADRENGTQGKVIVTFVVEKDGTLSGVKALRGPDQSMMDAAVQAIQQSPLWIPGMQNGKPVRVQYTIAFAFSLGGKVQ